MPITIVCDKIPLFLNEAGEVWGDLVAQLKDNNRTLISWASQYVQNRIREFGDADFLAAFDDASDNEAIKIGFRLYNRYGGAPSFLTAQSILDEIYKSYQNNRLISIKKCPNH